MDGYVVALVLALISVALFCTGLLMVLRRVSELEKRIALLEQHQSGT